MVLATKGPTFLRHSSNCWAIGYARKVAARPGKGFTMRKIYSVVPSLKLV